jgi:membrane-associated protein
VDEKAPEESAAEQWLRRNMTWLVLVVALVAIVLPRVSPYQPLNDYLNVFQRLSEWILEKLQSLFADYGYYVVFFGVLAENSMLLGFLVPGTIILMLAGLSAQNGSINLPLVIALAIAAAWLGDTISYFIGRTGWTRAVQRTSMGPMIEKVREPMETNRRWIILGYHFAGYSRAVGPIAAGIFRIRYRHWAPLDYTGATAWVLLYVAIGVVIGMFGVKFGDTKQMARLIELLFTALLVGAIAVMIWRALRQREADARREPDAIAAAADDE